MQELNAATLDFLAPRERQSVLRAIKEIKASNSSLYIGKRIAELRTILAPYGYFLKAQATLGIVLRTAYGYMYGYLNAMEQLPAGAVEAMMERKLVINSNRAPLGEWTDIIAAMPPPASGSALNYLRWVDEVIEAKPKRLTGMQSHRVRRSPEAVIAECAKAIERAARHSPTPATRERVGRRLIEITMRYFELEPGKFTPALELPERRANA